jgi:phosphatidylserine/phosphatidylglycerophosphate/cardiolipin synthase-like enzyme
MQKSAYIVILIVVILGAVVAVRQRQLGTITPDSSGSQTAIKRQDFPVPAAQVEDGIALYFSPQGGCEEAVVGEIERAKKTIDMQAYSFTSKAIAAALGSAQERGVRVRAVLDEKATGEYYNGATYLRDHGVAAYVDGQHPIAHNKVIIIDGQTIITGSFNFTKQAERENAENLLIITGRSALAGAYEENFEHHLGHSSQYRGVSGGGVSGGARSTHRQ